MDPISRVIAAGAAGAGTAEAVPLYVDDVFSTYVYDGTGSNKTITNGIDLNGKGGLVWLKCRNNSFQDHGLFDTARGVSSKISSAQNTSASSNNNTVFRAFNSDGFEIGSSTQFNSSSLNFISWTFREAPGFFDIVTWTGDTNSTKTLNHNLGSVPGCIMVKNLSLSSTDWMVYHRSRGSTKYIELNNRFDEETSSNAWNDTDPTSTQFTVGSFSNSNNSQYVAYLWAHDDQSFGENSDEAIIKCDSYIGNANFSGGGPVINLGFEPQWVMIKNATQSSDYGNWMIFDNMRGGGDGVDRVLNANRSDAENGTYTGGSSGTDYITFTSTGFKIEGPGYTATDTVSKTYIYIAIRRSHKPPTAGTDVFASQTNSPEQSSWTPGFAPDALFTTKHEATADNLIGARLTGPQSTLKTNANSAETTGTDYLFWDEPTGTIKQTYFQSSSDTGLHYAFKRAAGFFDIVAYTGTGSNRTVTHNLGVKPELMLVKNRDSSLYSWRVYSEITDATDYLSLNSSGGASDLNTIWNDTEPTSSVFTVGTNGGVNASGQGLIAYLFATLSGISKVGSYSGSSSSNHIDVDCGFTNGARFVLIKRTDADLSSWYVWDETRGINSGNDPFFLLNSNAAQVTNTDYIEPLAAGFKVGPSYGLPSALNASGGTYLFLAIA